MKLIWALNMGIDQMSYYYNLDEWDVLGNNYNIEHV
jgi:hypothetical protein